MKVYELNDCDWYIAPTLDEAIAAAMEDSGLPRDEAADTDAAEVLPEAMNRLHFVEDDGTRRTFAEELARRIESGTARTGLFATTEF